MGLSCCFCASCFWVEFDSFSLCVFSLLLWVSRVVRGISCFSMLFVVLIIFHGRSVNFRGFGGIWVVIMGFRGISRDFRFSIFVVICGFSFFSDGFWLFFCAFSRVFVEFWWIFRV